MGLPGGAVIVEDVDDNDLLEKPVTLLLPERVNADSLSRWRGIMTESSLRLPAPIFSTRAPLQMSSYAVSYHKVRLF